MTALPSVNECADYAARFYELFRGGPWYGICKPERKPPLPGVKVEIKRTAKTLRGGSTPELWRQHLSGEQSLGICPLLPDDTCQWGAIDIDKYDDLDHGALVRQTEAAGLPLVVCRSKSGGAHLYLFLSEPMSAADLRQRLIDMAVALRYPPDIEVFPKQASNAKIDKAGSWINVPYFDAQNTTRYAVTDKGLAMDLALFVEAAERARIAPDALMALKVSSPEPSQSFNTGGGPTPEAFDRWLAKARRRIAEAAPKNADDTLMKVARDIGRWRSVAEIDYQATQQKVLEAWHERGKSDADFHAQYHHCVSDGQNKGWDPRLMSGSDTHSGGENLYPKIDKLVVLVGGEEDLWRLTLAGYGDITLPVKEIMNYYTFNIRCASQLGAVYRQMKVNDWNDRLRDARSRAEYEEVPQDETIEFMLREQLRSFCMDRYRGDTIDELLLGKPVTVPEEDRIYFRFEDFQKFLQTGSSRFKNETRQRLGTLIGKAVGKDNYKQTMKVVKSHPKGIPVRWVRMSVFDQMQSLPLPPIDQPPL